MIVFMTIYDIIFVNAKYSMREKIEKMTEAL